MTATNNVHLRIKLAPRDDLRRKLAAQRPDRDDGDHTAAVPLPARTGQGGCADDLVAYSRRVGLAVVAHDRHSLCMFLTGRVRDLVPSPTLAGTSSFSDRQVGPLHAVAVPFDKPLRAVCGVEVDEVEGHWTPGVGLTGAWCRDCRARAR
jgi:hypothetical protein